MILKRCGIYQEALIPEIGTKGRAGTRVLGDRYPHKLGGRGTGRKVTLHSHMEGLKHSFEAEHLLPVPGFSGA